MKKLLALLFVTFAIVATTIAQVVLPPNTIPGVVYSDAPCKSKPTESFWIGVPGDPFTYGYCNLGTVIFANCPYGQAYNYNTTSCDYITQDIKDLYPNFPW